MNTRYLFTVICLLGLTASLAQASDENVMLGSAKVSLNLSLAGSYVLDNGEILEMRHDHGREKIDFQYLIYPATASYEGISNKILIEVHEMSISRPLNEQIQGKRQISGLEHCLEQSDMMPRRAEYQTEPYNIDGHEGILATVDVGQDEPFYIAAYSPDEVDGSGSIVCIVGSAFSWDTTERIFKSVRTQLAG